MVFACALYDVRRSCPLEKNHLHLVVFLAYFGGRCVERVQPVEFSNANITAFGAKKFEKAAICFRTASEILGKYRAGWSGTLASETHSLPLDVPRDMYGCITLNSYNQTHEVSAVLQMMPSARSHRN